MRELTEHDKALLIDSIPESNLVLFCPGLQGHGATLLDRSQYANHGTLVGVTWSRVPGRGQRTLKLDGTGHVLVPHDASLVLTDKVCTISVWVKPGTQLADYPVIIAKFDNDFSNGYAVSIPQDMSTVYWQIFDGVENKFVSSGVSLTADTWQNIAVQKTASDLKLYINGVQRGGDVAYSVQPNDSGVNLLLGAMYAGANVLRQLVGQMTRPRFTMSIQDPVQIYTRERHLIGV